MCVWVCVCVCVNIYADTDLYTAYMPRGGSMHGDRGKEVALHHPSRTQPSLLPRADPVSTISGLRRPRQGGRCSAPGEWAPLRSAGWNALRKPWTALESKHLLRLRWASFAGSLEVGPSVRGIIFFFPQASFSWRNSHDWPSSRGLFHLQNVPGILVGSQRLTQCYVRTKQGPNASWVKSLKSTEEKSRSPKGTVMYILIGLK